MPSFYEEYEDSLFKLVKRDVMEKRPLSWREREAEDDPNFAFSGGCPKFSQQLDAHSRSQVYGKRCAFSDAQQSGSRHANHASYIRPSNDGGS